MAWIDHAAQATAPPAPGPPRAALGGHAVDGSSGSDEEVPGSQRAPLRHRHGRRALLLDRLGRRDLRKSPDGLASLRDHLRVARPYFPFEVVDDLRKLGLHAAEVATQLGSVRVFASADSRVQVLFLHGVGMDSTMWSPLLLQASEDGVPTDGWTFIDLPGFGESDDLQGPVTMAEVGASLIEALNQMSVASCHLVGHSMGGFLAMDVAARYPQRFSSVCVVNGAYSSIVDTVNAPLRAAGRSPTTTVMYAMMVGVAQAGRAGTLALRGAAASGALRAGLLGAAAHPIHVRTSLLTALARGSRPRSFLRAQATGIDYDYRAIWSSLQVPLLALFGRSDHLVGRRDAAILAECQPSAVIRWIDDAGHFTPVEQPAAVLRALGDWWQRVG